MRDLVRYITKQCKIRKKDLENQIIEVGEKYSEDIAFLAYLILNSFSLVEPLTDSQINRMYNEHYYDGENLWVNYSLFGRENIHLDDALEQNDWFADLVLNSIIPNENYEKHEFNCYIDMMDDKECIRECLDELKTFCIENKLSKKIHSKISKHYKDSISDASECRCMLIKSPFFKKIFKNEQLKDLIENALDGYFLNQTTLIAYYVVYTECCEFTDGELLSSIAIKNYIEAYKSIYGNRGRKNKENANAVIKMLGISAFEYNSMQFITQCENTFDTKEQVMF